MDIEEGIDKVLDGIENEINWSINREDIKEEIKKFIESKEKEVREAFKAKRDIGTVIWFLKNNLIPGLVKDKKEAIRILELAQDIKKKEKKGIRR